MIIAAFGLAAAYWIDVATFAVAIVAIAIMRTPPFVPDPERPHPLRSLVEGWVFLFSRPLLLATMAVDFFAMFFGFARAIMPYYADRVFHVGPEGLGLLYAAPGVGATLVALTSGWMSGVERKGLGLLVSVAIFGLAMAAFGLVPAGGFALACALLAVGEGADTVGTVFRWTILQLETPDELRGRLSSINFLFVAGGPQLGQVESGVVAGVFSPEVSVVSGGLACLAVAMVAGGFVPDLTRYRTQVVEPSTT